MLFPPYVLHANIPNLSSPHPGPVFGSDFTNGKPGLAIQVRPRQVKSGKRTVFRYMDGLDFHLPLVLARTIVHRVT